MWHYWYRSHAEDEQPPTPGADPAGRGPETTVTWQHLLRESKDPGERVEDAVVASSRWARPMASSN